MKMILGADFPRTPPKGYFLTKIFHPNVSKSGEICVNVLKRDWKADLGLRHVLVIIRCLLIEPFPESALNEEAGKLLLEDYEEYAKHAKLMASIHAQPPKRSMPLTAAGGANAVNSTNGEAASAEAKEPIVKKPKAQDKLKTAAAVAKKRGLKRL
ncbi:Ubiquitin-conjugating enzyme E2 S-C [Trebouxia sp. C0010 RCD-2024]